MQRTVEKAEVNLDTFGGKEEKDVGEDEDEDEDEIGLQRSDGSDLLRFGLRLVLGSRKDSLERKKQNVVKIK